MAIKRQFLLLAFFVPSAYALEGTVAIDSSKPIVTIPKGAYGVNFDTTDYDMTAPHVPVMLKDAGISSMRFPGGSGSDFYHWKSNSFTPGFDLPWEHVNMSFDQFMGVVKNSNGNAIITVNYGTNIQGTGGGDPAEAAEWVDYSNNVKGYGVKYWEVGNETYFNGFYSGETSLTTDLHADKSPMEYGRNFILYAKAMKAKDPSIKVCANLIDPEGYPSGITPDWNSNVLRIAGEYVDCAIIHWYAQSKGRESDPGLLASTRTLPSHIASFKTVLKKYLGARGETLPILVTEVNNTPFMNKQTSNLVNGLFAPDVIMTFIKSGVVNVDWWTLHHGSQPPGPNPEQFFGDVNLASFGIISGGNCNDGRCQGAPGTPFATYQGMKMMNYMGTDGDQIVQAISNQIDLRAYAIKQADGDLGIMLINQNPSQNINANLNIKGYSPVSSATRYIFGMTSKSILNSSIGNASQAFSVSVAPYSITTLILKPSGSAVVTPPSLTAPENSTVLSVPMNIEAENMSIKSTGTQEDSGTAKVWNLFVNGYVAHKVRFPEYGKYAFTVTAKSPLVGDSPAHMEIHVDGIAVSAAIVQSDNLANFVLTAEVTAGVHTVGVVFTNDDYINGQDRNLYVDKLAIAVAVDAIIPPVSTAIQAPGSLEAETMEIKSGGGVENGSPSVWAFYANGSISSKVNFTSSSSFDFAIPSKASLAFGVGATMQLLIDGVPVGSVMVSNTAIANQVIRANVIAGEHTVALAFINDDYDNATRQDRNLYVDKIIIAQAVVAPKTIEAESMSASTGGTEPRGSSVVWAFYAGGNTKSNVNFESAGNYRVDVTGFASLAFGVGAAFDLKVDGVTKGSGTFSSSTMSTIGFDVNVSSGQHEVMIVFTNDSYDNATGNDRNLYLDKLVISKKP